MANSDDNAVCLLMFLNQPSDNNEYMLFRPESSLDGCIFLESYSMNPFACDVNFKRAFGKFWRLAPSAACLALVVTAIHIQLLIPCASSLYDDSAARSSLRHHYIRTCALFFTLSITMHPLGRSALSAARQTQRRCYSSVVGSYADTAKNLKINKDTRVVVQGFTG